MHYLLSPNGFLVLRMIPKLPHADENLSMLNRFSSKYSPDIILCD